MSVTVKNMKMPESCSECPLFDWDLDYIKCKATDVHFLAASEWRAGRHPTCPLEENTEQLKVLDLTKADPTIIEGKRE